MMKTKIGQIVNAYAELMTSSGIYLMFNETTAVVVVGFALVPFKDIEINLNFYGQCCCS